MAKSTKQLSYIYDVDLENDAMYAIRYEQDNSVHKFLRITYYTSYISVSESISPGPGNKYDRDLIIAFFEERSK